jgi:hypothetical protein
VSPRSPANSGDTATSVTTVNLAFRGYGVADKMVLEDPPPPLPADPPRVVPEQPEEPTTFDWALVPALAAERNAPDPAWWDLLPHIPR